MKTHTGSFKYKIAELGRELDSKLTIGSTVFRNENINYIKLSYEGALLKSVMKKLEFDVTSTNLITTNSNIKFEFGIKVGDEYEYLNYGNYLSNKVEKQADTNSYRVECYDYMIRAMTDYKPPTGITYPITVREYIKKICQTIKISFANSNDTFVNYDKIIEKELYADLGYTYRDVLDELAQVTASTICINDDGELEVRYIKETNCFLETKYLKNTNVSFGKIFGPINSIVLSRSADSDCIYLRDEESLKTHSLCEIKIKDNQIMNGNNRDEFLPGILNQLKGLKYTTNNFASTGICFLELCDKYHIDGNGIANECLMLNDEIIITQGLEENIYTEMPEESVTDYTKADKTDRKINQTNLIVDKQNQTIDALVQQVTESENSINTQISNLNVSVGNIDLSVKEFTTQVDETMQEMSSQLDIQSNAIDLKLNASDFNSSAVIGLINNQDGTSSAKIEATNIDLYGLNLNLTSDYITISSNNFSVDRYGNVTANNATLSGEFTQYSSSNKLSVKISNNKIMLYDWESNGEYTGAIAANHILGSSQHNLSIHCDKGNSLSLGYNNGNVISSVISFDTTNLNDTPYIANTVSGTMFPSNPYGGIEVEHGLIKDWNLKGLTGDIEIQTTKGKLTLTLANGLIVNNTWS